jgi:hypothetical protein
MAGATEQTVGCLLHGGADGKMKGKTFVTGQTSADTGSEHRAGGGRGVVPNYLRVTPTQTTGCRQHDPRSVVCASRPKAI